MNEKKLLNKVNWPEKKQMDILEIGASNLFKQEYSEKAGWNACHDAFMKILVNLPELLETVKESK